MMLLFFAAADIHSCIPGCGWTLYNEPDNTRVSIVVCNFVEEGNVKNTAVYKTGTACANCDSNYTCNDSLCIKD